MSSIDARTEEVFLNAIQSIRKYNNFKNQDRQETADSPPQEKMLATTHRNVGKNSSTLPLGCSNVQTPPRAVTKIINAQVLPSTKKWGSTICEDENGWQGLIHG